MKVITKNRNIHFVGIGGAGMSGLAIILHNLGFQVSGSDRVMTSVTQSLQKAGIKVHKGHGARYVRQADLVVHSSAVKQDNVELQAAHEAHIPVIRRAEMLGEIMRMKFSIAISGTHGKTSTTSMIGSVFQAADLSPTLIVGGIVRDMDTSARLGRDSYAVVEADEFDRSFLAMYPSVAVVTTLEVDHLDCYKDLDDIKHAFVEFCNKVPFYGCSILCVDEPSVQDILPRIEKAVITYGLLPQADYTARHAAYDNYITTFKAYHQNELLGPFKLQVPGEHNVKNALAAIAVARELNIPIKKIQKGLAQYKGVRRRFEVKGTKRGVTVVDDYAHHPTEITATLKAAKEIDHNRLVAVFQPHLYSRTRDFFREFAASFLLADILVVTDVYPAREKPIQGVSGQWVTQAAKGLGHRDTHYVSDKAGLPRFLKGLVKKGDLVITMGAGDIYKFSEKLLEQL